jgi:hypothetical protein
MRKLNKMTEPKPVIVKGKSVVIRPNFMMVGKFYLVDYDGKQLIYRKKDDLNIEVYEILSKDK